MWLADDEHAVLGCQIGLAARFLPRQLTHAELGPVKVGVYDDRAQLLWLHVVKAWVAQEVKFLLHRNDDLAFQVPLIAYTHPNTTYRMTSTHPNAFQTSHAYSFAKQCPMIHPNAFQTSQAYSFVKQCPMIHPKDSFEAPCSSAHYRMQFVYDDILYLILN